MNTEKEKVGPGKFVRYSYTLTEYPDGKLLFETPADAPDELVYGVSHEVIPGLLAALKDLAAGDRFEVVLPPEAAFGERYDDNVVTLEKAIFECDGKLADEVVVGAELPMMTAEGFRILGRVLEIDEKNVKMDFNHPFAGKTVEYKGEVVEVRDATPEELQPAHGCGGGCCGGGCGDKHDDGEGCCGGGNHEGGCCGSHGECHDGCCH